MEFSIGHCWDCPVSLLGTGVLALAGLVVLAASRLLARSPKRWVSIVAGALLAVAAIAYFLGLMSVTKYGIAWSDWPLARVPSADLTFLAAWYLATALLLLAIRKRD